MIISKFDDMSSHTPHNCEFRCNSRVIVRFLQHGLRWFPSRNEIIVSPIKCNSHVSHDLHVASLFQTLLTTS